MRQPTFTELKKFANRDEKSNLGKLGKTLGVLGYADPISRISPVKYFPSYEQTFKELQRL
jgi:hypothetical protein